MPLLRGQSGEPYGRSEGSSRPGLATAYAMRKKMARGGDCQDCASGKCMKHGGMMAKGGKIPVKEDWLGTTEAAERRLMKKSADREQSNSWDHLSEEEKDRKNARVGDRDANRRIMGRQATQHEEKEKDRALGEKEGYDYKKKEDYTKARKFHVQINEPTEDPEHESYSGYPQSDEEEAERKEKRSLDRGYAEGGEVDDRDMVSRIMRRRMSEGGRVSNEEHGEDQDKLAGYSPNEFDVLELDDDLSDHDTGANSGDELGDEQEDEDRGDMISRIMKSRRLKDRNPRPA